MRTDEEWRGQQHRSSSQFQPYDQSAPRKPVSKTSADTADGDRSERLDYECERDESRVLDCQVDRHQRCNLSERIAECGYPDRGDQAAEPRIGPEDPERCDASRNFRAIHNVQRLKAVQFPERVDDVGVVPMVCPPADVFHALDWSHQRRSVETSAGDSVVRVRDRQDSCAKRSNVALETGRIARPVPALMVVADDRRHLRERRVLSNHVRPDVGMASHDLPFVFAEGSGLIQYVIADADLPEVMERACSSDQLAFAVTQFEMLPQFAGQLGYAY